MVDCVNGMMNNGVCSDVDRENLSHSAENLFCAVTAALSSCFRRLITLMSAPLRTPVLC